MSNLDVMRAIAVLLVLADHIAETAGLGWSPHDFALGRAGVLLFFVHTALVLTQSLQRLKLSGWELVQSFYIRRAFRIYPLAIACIALVLILQVPVMPWQEYVAPSAERLASNLTLTTNLFNQERLIGPLWSLPIELQMYLLLPFIFMIVRGRLWMAVVLWFVAVALGLLQPYLSGRLDLLKFGPAFMAGVIAATLPPGKMPGWLWPVFLAGVVAAYVFIHGPLPAQWGLCLAVGLALSQFRDLPRIRVAEWIARYSYGIYLFHIVALWVYMIVPGPQAARWIIALAVLAGLSITAYHLLEKPMMDLGAYLAKRVRDPNPSSSETVPVPASMPMRTISAKVRH